MIWWTGHSRSLNPTSLNKQIVGDASFNCFTYSSRLVTALNPVKARKFCSCSAPLMWTNKRNKRPHLKIDAWAVRSAQIPANLIFFFRVSTQSQGNRASARHLLPVDPSGWFSSKVLMVDPAICSKLLLDTPTPILLLLNLCQIASIMIHILHIKYILYISFLHIYIILYI